MKKHFRRQQLRAMPQASVRRTWNAPESNRVWLSLAFNGSEPAEMCISGQIGKFWYDDSGTSGKEFRDALKTIPAGQKINLRINSEGGSVQDGLDIYNAIKERRENITAHITGYAVSIASVIPLAASRVISPISSVWMIHEPWSVTEGDADEHRRSADMLDKHGDMLAQIYSEETGKSKKAMRDAMEAETWFTGSEACDFGLSDATEADDDETISNLRKLDFKNFKKVPAAIQNTLQKISASFPPAPAGNQNQKTENNMDKKIIVALLKSHGIEASETETEAQLQAKLEKIPKAVVPATPAAAAGEDPRITKLIRDRITDKVTAYVDTNQITKAEVALFVEAALKDEAGTMTILAARPVSDVGNANAGSGVEMGRENELPPGLVGVPSNKLKNLAIECKGDKKKLYAGMRDNMAALRADAVAADRINASKAARMGVQAANTISATLTTNFLIMGATTTLSPKFPPLRLFTKDNSVDPIKPLATGQLKYNTTPQDGSTTLTNPTNWEQGDSTVTNVPVTVNQLVEPFHLTTGDLNDGIRMEDLVTAKLASLGSKYTKSLCAVITAANFATLAAEIAAQNAFGFSNTQSILGKLKKATQRNLMIDGAALAKLTNIPSLFQATPDNFQEGRGWKNLIGFDWVGLNTEWTAAGNNIYGFAGDPQALGSILGLPLMDSAMIPGGILAMANGTLPGCDVPIMVTSWFNPATRIYWASFEGMAGFAALDTTAGVVVASGAPS